ncbi:TPA: hypothetical protein PXA68_000665 [Mannheimia haemolytica]|nr:hypothetical protein [Mannheimia haemolytica]
MRKVYISTINAPLAGGGAVMPIVEAFFVDKKTAERFKAENVLRGEVKEICPTDYTITILLDMGVVAIPAKGFKHDQQAAEALPSFKAVMPTAHFEIVKFCETALYKRNIQEANYD